MASLLKTVTSSILDKKTGIIAASLLLTMAIGVSIPYYGYQVIIWLVVPIIILFIFGSPFIGLLLMVATIPLESVAVYQEDVTATRIIGTLVFGLWLFFKLRNRQSVSHLFSTPVARLTILLLALMSISVMWARDSAVVIPAVFSFFQLFMLSILVADVISTWKRADLLVKLIISASLITSLLTLQQFYSSQVIRAGEDVAGGVNATAYIMVALLPFAFYLMESRQASYWRILGIVHLSLSALAILTTFSRSSIIILALALLIQYWRTLSKRKGGRWILVASIVFAASIALSPEELFDRIRTVIPYLESSITGADVNDEDSIGSRGYIYRVGIAVIRDHPVLGVGYLNFGDAYYEYQNFVPGNVKYIDHLQKSPHSSFLALFAELGVSGISLWLFLLILVIRQYRDLWYRHGQSGVISNKLLLIQASMYSFVIHIPFALVRNVHREKLFWLLIGLVVAMQIIEKTHLNASGEVKEG